VAQCLLDSLLCDYATQSVKCKLREVDDASLSHDLQVGAAMRLLYYFPKQSAALIARRLVNPQVDVDFVQAVSWSPTPRIRAAIRSLFRRTTDVDVLRAALPGLNPSRDWPLVGQRLRNLLLSLPPDSSGDDYLILTALHDFGGEKARPLFRAYLEGGRRTGYAQRCFSLCEVLKEASVSWDREMLLPLLRDRRVADGYSHPIKAGSNESVPMRVCDEAAEALCAHRKDITFTMTGTTRDLDRQIHLLLMHFGKEIR
jgi:hypothetical protein